ncbi:carbohydrate ABC transporter permease [Butyrivibrio sp. MC2013]|uniref:carbohydrate ABC transporter permease n=1 Tax=Butyrivibrio sp. MC2013 TaxID=1280686 RepID=UPI000419ECAA|nr:sugar ABC transporter permease [Butyrivibrio sp. MC2013]
MTRNKKWIAIFLLPGVALFAYIFLASLLVLITTSFTDWTIAGKLSFIGIKNYVDLFTADKGYLTALKNTIVWIFLQSTIHVLFGTMVALILAKKHWYSNAMRTVFFIPNIISSAALGMLFLCILNPQFGLINNLIKKINGDFNVNWFMDPKTAFLSVTLTWLPYAGLVTILVISEMSSISDEIIEAAKVDGATPLQADLYIVLPLMRNIIGTSTVLAATSMLQKLDIIMMTTSGGPGVRTMNMPMYLYQTVFSNNNFGLANAQGVLLILLGVLSLVIIRKLYRMDDED